MSSIQALEGGDFRVRFRQNGKGRSKTFINEDLALKWKALLDAAGPAVALALLAQDSISDLTVGQLMESHIVSLTGVTDGTRKGYRSIVAKHMADLASTPVSLLDRETVAKWINRLTKTKYRGKPMSGKTIANVHGLLSAALNTAISDKIITDNPCKGMRLPRTDHDTTEMVFLTVDEFDRLYDLIPPHYQPFILTLVGTGMRFGEATALTVGDIDLETRSIRIKQAWKKTGYSQRELGASKTKRSKRTVAMPPEVIDALAPLIEGRSPKDYLFLNLKGKPIDGSFGDKTWSKAVRAFAGDTVTTSRDKSGRKVYSVAKLGDGKHPRIHDLRHTFASWAIQDNIPLTTIQRQLGHESIKTTSDRYGHLARSDYDILANSTSRRLPSRTRAIEG